MRWILRLGLIAVAGYVAVAAYFFAIQRQGTFPGASFDGFVEAPDVVVPDAERLTLSTPDGERLAAWYRPPRDGQPVVLFLHGNAWHLERMTRRWSGYAKQGAGVLTISYRGFPGSTGTPSEQGIAMDARTAYDWLAERHPARDIVIHGFSLGTGVATGLAATVPARGLILEAPFISAVALGQEYYPFLPAHLLLLDQFRSDTAIAQVNMPVLIAHGTSDDVIPYAHGQTLHRLAAEPKRLVTIDGGEHSDLIPRGLLDHVWRFLDDTQPQ